MEWLQNISNWQWRDINTLWFTTTPLIWFVYSYLSRRKQESLYADENLLPWVKINTKLDTKTSQLNIFKQLLHPQILLSIAWVALVIILAGPRISISSPDESSRTGVDILIAIDLSQSMTAQDTAPNRFLFSRSLIESFVNRLENNDRLGLMAYAAQPHLVSPLSFDRNLFAHYLNLIHPGMLPTKGSLLKPALVFGTEHLAQTANRSPVLIVFTDGEPKNFQTQELPKNWQSIANNKTKIIIIGVGEHKKTPLPDSSHKSGYLHSNGLLVKSSLEETGLKSLAEELNAFYLPATKNDLFITTLIDTIANLAEQQNIPTSKEIWQDLSSPFIWLALFSLLLAFYPLKLKTNKPLNSFLLPSLFIGLFISFSPQTSFADASSIGLEQQAYQVFKHKQFNESQQLYSSIENYQGWFGAGSSAYLDADYAAAVEYFKQAALSGKTLTERSRALFNLGNTFYQANLMPQAIESYQQALHYLPNNKKTQNNLALAMQQFKQEQGQQADSEQGEGQGEGTTSRDSEGAFYGGQKPNASEAGEGFAGDAPEGTKQGNDFVLPNQQDKTDFSLQQSTKIQLNNEASAIVIRQHNRQRMGRFELDMQQVQDNQTELLIRLFERSEGFQARQEQPHAVPGVKPW